MKKLLIAVLTIAIMTTVIPNFNNSYSMINEVEAKAKVKLNKTKLTLVKGKSYTLKVMGNKKKIKWSTSNKKVAIVNSKGKVTGKKAGTCTITAKIGSKKYKCKVTVKNPIKLNKTKVTLNKGKTYTLKVSGTKKKVTWSSSNKKVATVNSKGKVTAKKKGIVTITAKADGLTVKSKVTVKNPTKSVAVDMLSLDITSVSLNKGNTYKMKVTVFPLNATNKAVTYTTSNKSVVTVSNGIVKAVGVGTATVTAKSSNGKTVSCKFTVKNAKAEVSSVTLNKSTLSLNVGDTQQLTATINPSNATNKSVEWQSTNTNVVTVSSTGKVIAKKVGTATILVVASNGMSATCQVTVKDTLLNEEQKDVETEVNSITLSTTSLKLNEYESTKLTANVIPSNAINQKIKWVSSDDTVVFVSINGTVKALKEGKATITASTKNGKTATCQVTVTKNQPKYKYDIEFLNEHGFYSGLNIVTHVKTNNPFNWYNFDDSEPYLSVYVYTLDGKFIDTFAGRPDYADIHFDTENYGWSERKVKDGFLIEGSIEKAGTYNIVVEEKIPNTTRTIQVCSKKVTVLDKDKEEKKYIQNLINEITDNSMTEREKLQALEKYIRTNYIYYQKRAAVNDNLLNKAPETTPYWISKEFSCYGSSSLMYKIGQELGYTSTLIYTSGIGWGGSDHRCTLIDLNNNGSYYKNGMCFEDITDVIDIETGEFYDACPLPNTYTVNGIDYFYSRQNITYIDANW